jgi:hypothetical protein
VCVWIHNPPILSRSPLPPGEKIPTSASRKDSQNHLVHHQLWLFRGVGRGTDWVGEGVAVKLIGGGEEGECSMAC